MTHLALENPSLIDSGAAAPKFLALQKADYVAIEDSENEDGQKPLELWKDRFQPFDWEVITMKLWI